MDAQPNAGSETLKFNFFGTNYENYAPKNDGYHHDMGQKFDTHADTGLSYGWFVDLFFLLS